jgi:hypothetical protein
MVRTDKYFKADFAWRPPVALISLAEAHTTQLPQNTSRLPRNTPPCAPGDVSHTLVLAARGRRDAKRAHRGHDRPTRKNARATPRSGRCGCGSNGYSNQGKPNTM